MRKKIIITLIVLVAATGAFLAIKSYKNEPKPNTATTVKTTDGPQEPQANDQPTFNKKLHSIDDPASIWVIANKLRPLNPADYAPSDLVFPKVPLRSSGEEMKLRKDVAAQLEKMFDAAKQDGLNLMLASGYRSYLLQISVYSNVVKQSGQAKADTESARPGHSEHQTGFAADIEPASRECEVADCFGDLAEGKWVAANAFKFGFLQRYTMGKEKITGYRAEPWHYRYVGTELANELRRTNTATLEEFFGIADENQPY